MQYLCLCREFFYIQMEKYARQALADGVKSVNELVVTTDAEIYRVLILHYNRNNQIEVCDGVTLTLFMQCLLRYSPALQISLRNVLDDFQNC